MLLPQICKKERDVIGWEGKRGGEGDCRRTAFICPLVPFRVASYVLRLVLLLLVAALLLLAALVEHLFEELELSEG